MKISKQYLIAALLCCLSTTVFAGYPTLKGPSNDKYNKQKECWKSISVITQGNIKRLYKESVEDLTSAWAGACGNLSQKFQSKQTINPNSDDSMDCNVNNSTNQQTKSNGNKTGGVVCSINPLL